MTKFHDLRVRTVVEWPSTLKTSSRVNRLSPKLKIRNLSPNKDTRLSTIWFFTQPFYSQTRYLSSKMTPSLKEAQLESSKFGKTVFSLLFSEQDEAQ